MKMLIKHFPVIDMILVKSVIQKGMVQKHLKVKITKRISSAFLTYSSSVPALTAGTQLRASAICKKNRRDEAHFTCYYCGVVVQRRYQLFVIAYFSSYLCHLYLLLTKLHHRYTTKLIRSWLH